MSNDIKWFKGANTAYDAAGATKPKSNSVYAKSVYDGCVYLSIETDHQDTINNNYMKQAGLVVRYVPPLDIAFCDHYSHLGDISGLYDILCQLLKNQELCGLVLIRGTRNGITRNGPQSALDDGKWRVVHVKGCLKSGYSFVLSQV